MARVADLPRIRRALANLDRIAADHPEYCQGKGQWNETDVEKIVMGTPAKVRVKSYRDRLREQGYTRESFFATPEAQAALNTLRAIHPDKTRDDIICEVLNLAAQSPTAAPAIEKVDGIHTQDDLDWMEWMRKEPGYAMVRAGLAKILPEGKFPQEYGRLRIQIIKFADAPKPRKESNYWQGVPCEFELRHNDEGEISINLPFDADLDWLALHMLHSWMRHN